MQLLYLLACPFLFWLLLYKVAIPLSRFFARRNARRAEAKFKSDMQRRSLNGHKKHRK